MWQLKSIRTVYLARGESKFFALVHKPTAEERTCSSPSWIDGFVGISPCSIALAETGRAPFALHNLLNRPTHHLTEVPASLCTTIIQLLETQLSFAQSKLANGYVSSHHTLGSIPPTTHYEAGPQCSADPSSSA